MKFKPVPGPIQTLIDSRWNPVLIRQRATRRKIYARRLKRGLIKR